jgi:hypothetical protein
MLVVRIVGSGEPSSRLYHPHWDEDLSEVLMKSGAIMMKNHETLQRPEEILLVFMYFLHTDIPNIAKCAFNNV